MALSNDDILNAIADMSVMDVVKLVEAMEEKFGVSATAVAVAAGGPVASDDAPSTEEKTEFDVTLASFGEKKMDVIKAVRAIDSSLGLKDAKALVESAPKVFKEGVTKEEAEDLKKQLEAAGATVEVK